MNNLITVLCIAEAVALTGAVVAGQSRRDSKFFVRTSVTTLLV